MRLPLFKSNFRLTHRFAGNLKRGTFSQQASSLFGIDQGAIIGFDTEWPSPKACRHRSTDRASTGRFSCTVSTTRSDSAGQCRRLIPALASVEGANNFREKDVASFGVVVSRIVGTRVAAYLTPIWTDNTTASLEPIAHDHDAADAPTVEGPERQQSTTSVGVGARVRVHADVCCGEIVPRASGYAPDEPAYGVSIEKRVGSQCPR